MSNHRLVERPAFEVLGRKTWISGQNSELFRQFWGQCWADGLMDVFDKLGGFRPGPQTGGVMLGISRVEQDPAERAFDYMIAIERPEGGNPAGLEVYRVPASQWAVFECRGKVPEGLVEAEIYAFTEWLPGSEFIHAFAPEMEVYLPADEPGREGGCEFWLPVARKV